MHRGYGELTVSAQADGVAKTPAISLASDFLQLSPYFSLVCRKPDIGLRIMYSAFAK